MQKITPKKSFGQNFLNSGKAIFEMLQAGEVKSGETIIEIGPGKGALTKALLLTGAKVIAIELDRDLLPFLQEEFKDQISSNRLTLLNEDILTCDIEKILKENKVGGEGYKLVANIPYYITGAIIEKFLSLKTKPKNLSVLVQKEVAERVVAKDKKESILSLSVKLYGIPKMTYKVSAGSFFPKPKVDSAILKIEIFSENFRKEKFIKDEEIINKYFLIVKASFAHKRKMMLGNLKTHLDTYNWDKIFKESGLSEKVRAEDLTREDFLLLANNI